VGIAELVALGRVEAAGRAAVGLAKFYTFSGAPAGRGLQLVMDAAHSADNASTLATTSRFAALLAMSRSELDTARLLLDQSLTVSRRLGDALLEAHCLRNLGELQQMLGDMVAARESLEDALQAYQNIEFELGVADCYLRLGELDVDESRVAARRLFGQAMQIYRSIGHTRGYANCLIGLGTLDFQESMIENARELFNQALPICEDVGYPQGEANCYLMLGRLDLGKNVCSTAQANLTRALSLFKRLGDQQGRDECYETLGELRNRIAEQ
jgi:tetratricopeptide (TPR) repeat protein